MKRQFKKENSAVLTNRWTYPANRSQIKNALLDEQNHRCAYTETYLGRTDKAEIEHFNPSLKNKMDDDYQNWFLVKAQWNNEKGSVLRWKKYQPLLHPTDLDLEKRIVYFEGDYISEIADIEANNLIKFLKLDDLELAEERKLYIKRRKDAILNRGIDAQTYFEEKLNNEPASVYFGIKLRVLEIK
jgi:hypothetical protein